MEKNKDYIYYGLFLSEDCKSQIERQIERMDGYNKLFETRGRLYIDHCTLLHYSQENKFPEIKKEIVELESRGFERYSTVMMKVTHIGYLANKVMAIKVDPFDFPCANEKKVSHRYSSYYMFSYHRSMCNIHRQDPSENLP